MFPKLKKAGRSVAREIRVYRLVLEHEGTPWPAQLILGAALAYLASPIDLIPDWLPVVGHLDDVIVVPVLVWLALKLVPADVVTECRSRAG